MTKTENKKETFYTDYKTAATWGDASLVLCNKLPDIDTSIWDNARFSMYETDEEGNENDYPIDIYQYFITDLQDWQIVGREFHNGYEQNAYDLYDMLKGINEEQPEAERLNEDLLKEFESKEIV